MNEESVMTEKNESAFTKEWVCICQKTNSIRSRTCTACGSQIPSDIVQKIFKEELVSLTKAVKQEKKADTATRILAGQEKFFKRAGYLTASLTVVATAVFALRLITNPENLSISRQLIEIPKELAQNAEAKWNASVDDAKRMAGHCVDDRVRFFDRVDKEWSILKERYENVNIVTGIRDNALDRFRPDAFNEEVSERTDKMIQKWSENVENTINNCNDVKDKITGRANDSVDND